MVNNVRNTTILLMDNGRTDVYYVPGFIDEIGNGSCSKFLRVLKMAYPYHPLLNDVIMSRVFDHLNGTEIMKCRLVCTTWETLSQPFFTKRCCIVIRPIEPKKNSRHTNYAGDKLDIFCKLFPETFYTEGLLVSSFVLNGIYIWDAWLNFFETRKHWVKELTLNRVHLLDDEEAEATAQLLKRSICIINHLIIPTHLTSLNITSFSDLTRFSLSLKVFVSIESLRLSQCTVIVEDLKNGESRIKPKEIHLQSVYLKKKSGEVLDLFVVNDLVDFQRVKKASFWGTNMELDMGDPLVCINDLNLMHTPISNWAESAWTIRQLTLTKIRFVTNSLLKVKHLTIRDCFSVDVEAIPRTVENLSFHGNGNIMSSSNYPVFLPCLTSLHLAIADDLSLFVQTPSLTSISYG